MHGFTDNELRLLRGTLETLAQQTEQFRDAAFAHYEATGERSEEIFDYMRRAVTFRKMFDLIDAELAAR